METLHTPYGPIPVAGVVERSTSGAPLSCTPAAEARLATPCGELVPQHSTDDLRRRTVQAVSFHADGALRSLPLERPTPVATPAGPMQAELVTFHPDGALHRVFPLNGKLSGYWTQEDEGRLAGPVTLRTPLGLVTARLIAARFGQGGELLGLTLWPSETLPVATPVGAIQARTGISFRPDGSLRSLEPARPHSVPTPAGFIQAFDPDAVGISGDVNSLAFAQDGRVEGVSTILSRLVATGPDGAERVFAPQTRESLCGDGERESAPLRVEFAPGLARIRQCPGGPWAELPLDRWRVRAEPYLLQFATQLGPLRCSC